MASDNLHEPSELLSEETRNKHRAIVSLMEELEAVDWYQQRADACTDEALAAVLVHNKNEEIEHAMMTLEWLIRNDSVFAENARTYLFTDAPITEIEDSHAGAESPSSAAASTDGSLGIGSLKD